MRQLAIVVDNRIDNLILGNPADFPDALDVTDMVPQPGIGWVRAAPGEPFQPPAAVPVVEDRRVTRLAFRNRFTQAELVAMEMAALDNPAGTSSQRQAAAGLRVMLANVDAATFIDLSRADTRAGVQQLEAAGIIGAGRAAAILDGPITEVERPPA